MTDAEKVVKALREQGQPYGRLDDVEPALLSALADFVEAAVRCHALMVRPAHVFSCGAYKSNITGKVDCTGTCTCGVDAASKDHDAALARLREVLC